MNRSPRPDRGSLFDFSPIKLRPCRCRICGRPHAYYVPELNRGYVHYQCWMKEQAKAQLPQQGEQQEGRQ